MKTRKKWLDIILNTILVIGSVLCVCLITFKLTFIKVVVSGSSMEPTISDGALGYMVKVNDKTKIERFDVVVCEHGYRDGYYIIKRVVGLPNEEIKLLENKLYVNGEEVKQDFTFNERKSNHGNFDSTAWKLHEGQYLVVGDNRNGTMEPAIESKEKIIAKNGFCYKTYDVKNNSCNNNDYKTCPIDNRNIYWFKEGQTK